MSSLSAAEIVEFRDCPEPGRSLFVQSQWHAALPKLLPPDDEPLCELLACDAESSWKGGIYRCNLSQSLKSWDESNLEILRRAFNKGTSKVHSTWMRGPLGDDSLQLTVRFQYKEGKLAAIPRLHLQPVTFGEAISRFTASARKTQAFADERLISAAEERRSLQSRREELRRALETWPQLVEGEEQRLLRNFAAALNAQKRRNRELRDSGREAAGRIGPCNSFQESLQESLQAPEPSPPAQPPPAPPSLREPIKREGTESLFDLPMTQGLLGDTSFTASIPLTLGMGSNCGTMGLAPVSGQANVKQELLVTAPGEPSLKKVKLESN